MAAFLAATNANKLDIESTQMIQLDSKAQLLSAALSMTNNREEAHALLQEALHTFEGVHSFGLMT